MLGVIVLAEREAFLPVPEADMLFKESTKLLDSFLFCCWMRFNTPAFRLRLWCMDSAVISLSLFLLFGQSIVSWIV